MTGQPGRVTDGEALLIGQVRRDEHIYGGAATYTARGARGVSLSGSCRPRATRRVACYRAEQAAFLSGWRVRPVVDGPSILANLSTVSPGERREENQAPVAAVSFLRQ